MAQRNFPLVAQFGIIQESEIYEERKFEWKISNVSSIIDSEAKYSSQNLSFAESSWCFVFCPEMNSSPGMMCLFLWKFYQNKYSVKYKCGLKTLNDGLKYIGRGIFEADKSGLVCYYLIKKSEFKQRCWFGLAPFDELTVTCILIQGIPVSPKFKKPKNLDVLSKSFKDLFTNKESCDTTLCVQEKKYKAHRLVLVARSSVFSAMFRHDMSENQTGIITIPDCDPDSFQLFLEYLYCGQLDDISFSSACHLYSTSDKYNVQDLKALCAEYLMEFLTVENVCRVVIMADMYDDAKLFSAAQNYFNKNMNEIFDTTEWDCLMKDNYRLAKKLIKQM